MANGKNPHYKELAKKISKVEILILLALILMWVMTYAWMNLKKGEHLETMFSLQGQVLSLAQENKGQDMSGVSRSWPFSQTFPLLVISDRTIVRSSPDQLMSTPIPLEEAFGKYINADVLLRKMHASSQGSDWIKPDKISQKQWVTWMHAKNGEHTLALLCDEKALLQLSGYADYSFMLLVCAVLASGLLLLALIWALSWMRLSAVKGLLEVDPS
ncbi:MAG: hypothetical protein ACP5G0_13830 [Desulfomonilia bacterium]